MRKFRIWVLAVLLVLVPFAGCERPDVPGDKTEKPDNSGTGDDQNGGENKVVMITRMTVREVQEMTAGPEMRVVLNRRARSS